MGAPLGFRPDASVWKIQSAMAGAHACMATAVMSGHTALTLAAIITPVQATRPRSTFHVDTRSRRYSIVRTRSITSAASAAIGHRKAGQPAKAWSDWPALLWPIEIGRAHL